MAHYQIKNVGFSYPDFPHKALENIHFEVEEGAFVLLCGPSGSGKTTLLRKLKPEVKPEGEHEGEIYYNGCLLDKVDEITTIEEIGMVFQDPDNQIVMNTVWQELTFAMENLGYPMEQIQRRLGEIVHFFGMEDWLSRSVHELSGGQKQMMNLASVMALRPKVLLLDEPTAQLDPIAAKEFLQLLARINEELSVTIIISEHRLEEIYPLASMVVMLDAGRLKYSGSPVNVFKEIWNQGDERLHTYMPSISRLFLSMEHEQEQEHNIPLTVKEGKKWIRDKYHGRTISFVQPKRDPDPSSHYLLECKDLYFQYEKDSSLILKKLSFGISKGEFFVLFGGNGSGKSTLLKNIVGALKPQSGKIIFEGRSLKKVSAQERSEKIGYVAQNPALYFTRETVGEQLYERLKKVKDKASEEELEKMIELFEIKDILEKHPFDISGGQQQKVVLVLALIANPEMIVLDEPTKGLDPLSKIKLAALLIKLREMGKTIFIVSHDIEFAAQYATRCGMLFNGMVQSIEPTDQFLKNNFFYTTIIHRTVGNVFPMAITLEDVVEQWELTKEPSI